MPRKVRKHDVIDDTIQGRRRVGLQETNADRWMDGRYKWLAVDNLAEGWRTDEGVYAYKYLPRWQNRNGIISFQHGSLYLSTSRDGQYAATAYGPIWDGPRVIPPDPIVILPPEARPMHPVFMPRAFQVVHYYRLDRRNYRYDPKAGAPLQSSESYVATGRLWYPAVVTPSGVFRPLNTITLPAFDPRVALGDRNHYAAFLHTQYYSTQNMIQWTSRERA